MTNVTEQSHRGRTTKPATQALPAGAETAPTDPGVAPQDFYHELVERPDVRRILTRLAQIKGSGA